MNLEVQYQSGVFTFHLNYLESFICSFIGNIIPVYFIVKYIRPLFDFFGRWKPFKAIIDWASERATKKIEESEKLQNFAALGLFLFVAIPLPGTGAWVGSLIANFLDLPPKKAIPPIVLGVLIALARIFYFFFFSFFIFIFNKILN